MPAVTVHNLDTQEELVYVDLTHAEAVRNAYAQVERRDGNTWEYERRYPLSMVHTRDHGDKRVYSLGRFSAVEGLGEVAFCPAGG